MPATVPTNEEFADLVTKVSKLTETVTAQAATITNLRRRVLAVEQGDSVYDGGTP